MLRPLVCLCLATLPTRSFASPASPSPQPSQGAAEADVADVRMTFTGNLPQSDEQALRDRLNDALERAHFVTTCDEDTCPEAGSRWDIAVQITAEGPDFRIELRATAPNAVTAIEEASACEICGLEELGENIEGLAARLRTKAEHLVVTTTFTVQSMPSGAQVELDGESIGITPLTVEVEPGDHALRIHKPGYREQTKEATLSAGADQTFSFRLARVSNIPHWLPWTLLGTGIAGIGSGVALLALHERPIEADCNPDLAGNCQYLHDTLGGGIALTITGLAATATAVGLAVVRQKQLHIAPELSAERIGVTLRGRF